MVLCGSVAVSIWFQACLSHTGAEPEFSMVASGDDDNRLGFGVGFSAHDPEVAWRNTYDHPRRGLMLLEGAPDGLDPTQRIVYEVLESWAQKHLSWRQRGQDDNLTAPPLLRLLLLGTSGIGKTHTALVAIQKVRAMFGRYRSVLTLALSSAAAANLGEGAQTIDSVFHTNRGNAVQDLVGYQLDQLVARLRHVELLVIDEISTVGAAQLEIINRRLQQVSIVVHQEQFGTDPPHTLGTFASFGVVLVGDFAQSPPVMASSLSSSVSIVKRPISRMRPLELAGRQAFAGFSQTIRLRRIHRQKGSDAFKESTMLLRDAVITTDDYDLWKTHEVALINQETSVCDWKEVTDNRQSGAINGKRLATTALLPQVPVRKKLAYRRGH